MHTLRRAATVLIWPAIAWLGACDQADAPTAPVGVVPEFGLGTGTLPGKVTGGGQINVVFNGVAGTGTFGFNARRADGVVSGHINYVNHVSGVHLNCEIETGGLFPAPPGQEPSAANFGGYECTPNSTFSNFTFTVVDNGEPGRNDEFRITYDAITDEGGTIRSGNIQVHNK